MLERWDTEMGSCMILLSVVVSLVPGNTPSRQLPIEEVLQITILIKRFHRASWPNAISCKITGLMIPRVWLPYLIMCSLILGRPTSTTSMISPIHACLKHVPKQLSTTKTTLLTTPPLVVLSRPNFGKQWELNLSLSPRTLIVGNMTQIQANMSSRALGHLKSNATLTDASKSSKLDFVHGETDNRKALIISKPGHPSFNGQRCALSWPLHLCSVQYYCSIHTCKGSSFGDNLCPSTKSFPSR